MQTSFSRAAAVVGEADTLPPEKLDCGGRVPAGQGRWLGDARWTYMFETAVPVGVRGMNFESVDGPGRQTCMALDDPDATVFTYIRSMTSALLVKARPASILIIGFRWRNVAYGLA